MKRTRRSGFVAATLTLTLLLGSAATGLAAQNEAWRQGFQAFQQKDYVTAERLFREALETYDSWGWLHMVLGLTLAERGKTGEALTELEKAKELVDKDQDRYMVNHNLAQLYLRQGQYDQAIAAEREAARYGGSAPQVAKTIGTAYYQKGDWRQAVDELEEAAASLSSDATVFAMLGRAYYELGRDGEALENLQRAVQLERGNRTALYFLGQLYLKQRNWSEAVRTAERAIQVSPQDTAIRNMLGRAYLGAKRYQEAVEAFQVVLQDERGRGEGNAYYNLGQAYQAMGQNGRAVDAYLNALQHLTNEATRGEAFYDLGMAYESVGRYEDSLRAFQDAAKINESAKVAEAIERLQERIRRQKESQP